MTDLPFDPSKLPPPKGWGPPPPPRPAKQRSPRRAHLFPIVRRGYSPDQVVAFLDEVLPVVEQGRVPPSRLVASGRPFADIVRNREFATVRNGYDTVAVRAELDRLADRLGPSSAPSTASQPPRRQPDNTPVDDEYQGRWGALWRFVEAILDSW